MKQFENKVLFIENEEMLEEVGNLLGFNIDNFVTENPGKVFNWLSFENYLIMSKLIVKGMAKSLEEITLEQFKELLKQK